MNTIVMGTILGGFLLLCILTYFIQLIVLIKYCLNTDSDNKGIRNLKFQRFNKIWQKYVLPWIKHDKM